MGYSIYEYFEDHVLPILKEVVKPDNDDSYTTFTEKLRDLFADQDKVDRTEYYQNYFRQSLLITAVGETTLEDFITRALELYSSDEENVRIKKIVVERDGKEVTIDYKDLDNSDALRDLLTDTRFVELVSEKILQKLGSTKSKG
jgi:hypothetical protein